MGKIEFARIAGEGANALYVLYINGERVGDALTMEEINKHIAAYYEAEKGAEHESTA